MCAALEASIERHLSSSMALINIKQEHFPPNQHAGNCMRQKWISCHSWALWKGLSPTPQPVFWFSALWKVINWCLSFYWPSTQTWENWSWLQNKTQSIRWNSAFQSFCSRMLFFFFFLTMLASCIKPRHMNESEASCSHNLFPFRSSKWNKLLIWWVLNLALEFDERSIYRNTLKYFLLRKKQCCPGSIWFHKSKFSFSKS